jgi:hypothetical protein
MLTIMRTRRVSAPQIGWLLATALIWQGCYHVPKWPPSPTDYPGEISADLEKVAHSTTEHPPKEMLVNLGTLGITSVDYLPLQKIVIPDKGVGQGAARGADVGVEVGARLGGICYIGAIICTPAFGIVGALVGSVYGAIAAPAVSTVEEAECAVNAALASVGFQESMKQEVLKAAKAQTDHPVVLAGPSTEFALPSDRGGTVNTLLKVAVVAIRLTAHPGHGSNSGGPHSLALDPDLRFGMIALATLIRVSDGTTLKYRAFEFTSAPHTFAEWAANRAGLLRQVIEQAQQRLADDMAYWVFFPLKFSVGPQ